jgi:hypothetical protein
MRARNQGLVVTLLALVACKPDPQVEAKNRQEVERVTQKLAKLVAAVPDPEALGENQPCDDAEIEQNYKAKAARLDLPGADYEFLKHASASPAPASDDGWSFLNAPGLREHLPKSRKASGTALGNAADALRNVDQARYVAVFRAAQRQLPKVDGDTFDGGMYDGHLIVMDLDAATVLCHALLEVESSDVVEFEQRGITGKSSDRALLEDFQKQFAKVGSQSLRAISKRVHVSLSGITLE